MTPYRPGAAPAGTGNAPPDAVIVGTGPNGLAAGVTLARAGLHVELYERSATIGGGLRSVALFDSDVIHDICSAVHPMAAASPFFRAFGLGGHGVELLTPDISYAHPLPGRDAALAHRDLDAVCEHLGPDGPAWRRIMRPLLRHSEGVAALMLSGQRVLPRDATAPSALVRSVAGLLGAVRGFSGEQAPALLAGVAAHATGPLPSLPATAITLLLGHLAHGTGWPLPRGGSGRIADALAADIRAHGGVLRTGNPVNDLRDVSRAKVLLLDTGPKEFLRIAPGLLPARYAQALRSYRYGPAAAKADFLVSQPIPWADPEVGRAGTVHLGGTRAQVFRQESLNARGVPTDTPFVLVVDPAVTDPGRARGGRRPVWAYAHVPHGDTREPVALIRELIERYAPGFTDTVLAAHGTAPRELEAYNPNYVGGDIGCGAIDLRQSLLRPVARWNPYRTPLAGVYLCSAATPPGPGVHGMSGYLAAVSVLRREFGIRTPPSLGTPGVVGAPAR
ncbi:NAD(P)/FAD-dependent oxidoreductase [Streptomyces flavidovirens]|uniref:phytoene desaturase family protein n=1 Tax=Streptomyces flavidovirens TaxID=67298 RepID=UPI0034277A59